MGNRYEAPSAGHKALYEDLMLALKKHEGMPPLELLAIMSNVVGKLIAVQDGTRYSKKAVLDMVTENMNTGNAEAIAMVSGPVAGNA